VGAVHHHGVVEVRPPPRELHRPRAVEPAAGTGPALRNIAPKSRPTCKRYIGNRRKHRSVAPDRPAP
jgi:hypothetical protein